MSYYVTKTKVSISRGRVKHIFARNNALTTSAARIRYGYSLLNFSQHSPSWSQRNSSQILKQTVSHVQKYCGSHLCWASLGFPFPALPCLSIPMSPLLHIITHFHYLPIPINNMYLVVRHHSSNKETKRNLLRPLLFMLQRRRKKQVSKRKAKSASLSLPAFPWPVQFCFALALT
jgi:hypothetical protein